MATNSKQQFKQYRINSIEDACFVLGSLIVEVIRNMDKYNEYILEVEALIESCKEEYVPAKVFDDINDKLLFRQYQILKQIADHQKSSFSYIDLRKLLEKNGYVSNPLSEKISNILEELLDVRNWTFHNPQSLLVASKEVAERSIPTEIKKKMTPQLNPVLVQKIDKYEFLMLLSLNVHVNKRSHQFHKVLESMKADYQEMYDAIENKPLLLLDQTLSSKVQYIEYPIVSSFIGQQTDIAQISMAIQKSKYDGSDKVFNEWSISAKVSSLDTADESE